MQVNSGSILPCRNAGEGVVGVDIGEPRVLRVIHDAPIQSHSDGELVASDAGFGIPYYLAGDSVLLLYLFRVDVDAITGRVRVARR